VYYERLIAEKLMHGFSGEPGQQRLSRLKCKWYRLFEKQRYNSGANEPEKTAMIEFGVRTKTIVSRTAQVVEVRHAVGIVSDICSTTRDLHGNLSKVRCVVVRFTSDGLPASQLIDRSR
jgi:hypothetical protein